MFPGIYIYIGLLHNSKKVKESKISTTLKQNASLNSEFPILDDLQIG